MYTPLATFVTKMLRKQICQAKFVGETFHNYHATNFVTRDSGTPWFVTETIIVIFDYIFHSTLHNSTISLHSLLPAPTLQSFAFLACYSFNNKLTEWLFSKNGFFSRNCFVILVIFCLKRTFCLLYGYFGHKQQSVLASSPGCLWEDFVLWMRRICLRHFTCIF